MCQSEINQKRPIELSGLLKIFLINQKIIVFPSDVRGMEVPYKDRPVWFSAESSSVI